MSVYAIAADKVVVIPLNTTPKDTSKLYGQGRIGVSLLTHDTQSGYCTANGINFAFSYKIATWNSAPSVCPSDTWVCSQAEVITGCSVPAGTYVDILCDGTNLNSGLIILGWNAETDSTNGTDGNALYSTGTPHNVNVCHNLRVWCCWN